MASKMRSRDHVIVVSLLVGVICLLILEIGKQRNSGARETENLARSTDPMRSPPDSEYRKDMEAQKRTVTDIQHTGTALFNWLTDQVGAAAAGQSQTGKPNTIVDLDNYHLISHTDLTEILVPKYMPAVPETDGWGHPYEYHLHVLDPIASRVMAIRSPGRDGKFSARQYEVSRFAQNNFGEDILWVDGYFVRWP